MTDGSELIIAHILITFSAFLSPILMQYTNLEKVGYQIGYRTPRSMKSLDTWKFANQFVRKYMYLSAVLTVISQIFSAIIFGGETGVLIPSAVMTITIIGALVITEIALKRNFDNTGKPKSSIRDRF